MLPTSLRQLFWWANEVVNIAFSEYSGLIKVELYSSSGPRGQARSAPMSVRDSDSFHPAWHNNMVGTGHYHFFAPLCRKWVWEEIQSKGFPLNQWIIYKEHLFLLLTPLEGMADGYNNIREIPSFLWATRYITKICYSGRNAGLH